MMSIKQQIQTSQSETKNNKMEGSDVNYCAICN